MNLDFLLGEVGLQGNFVNTEVFSVTENVKNVEKGSIFVAVKGDNADGNSFIEEAFERGATVVITDEPTDRKNVIRVADSRVMLSFLCSAFYSHPQYKMVMVGITGTNGKTTTAEYLRHIISHSGRKCAVIGTLGCRCDGYESETGYTTPSPEVLYRELKKIADNGTEFCIMEVSSQALAQKRVEPIEFSIGVFTNIGTDHTDYHGSMEKYVRAKTKLFALSDRVLINADDAYAEYFINAAQGKTVIYSAKDRYADYMAKNIRFFDDNVSYIMLKNGKFERFQFSGAGEISVYNTLAAASAADLLGIDFSVSASAFRECIEVKGRLQKISSAEKTVYIDFAHTPEALEAVLKALRIQTQSKLICVFGCGGDRDKSKRGKMGSVASSLSDEVIITSDNPRSEEPEKIISDILKGVNNKKNILTVKDRKDAIVLALNKCGDGDVVLIAGKGHEEYQLIQGEKKYFSDELTVKEYLGVM